MYRYNMGKIIYHGSQNMIETPRYGVGKLHNDYELGFYCTESIDLAREVVLMPQTEMVLEQMGEQIKLARLRRKLSTELVAERAGINRATLCSIEKGAPSVSIGMYAAVPPMHLITWIRIYYEWSET